VCGFDENVDRENEFLMDIEYLRTGEACSAAE
jgi:hypothetical protein